jgi:hypothetical protein
VAVGLGLFGLLIVGHAAPEHKIEDTPPAPVEYVLIRITSHPGKYATRGVKGDLLVAPKAEASECPSTEAPRRQKDLERRGFKTKVEPAQGWL